MKKIFNLLGLLCILLMASCSPYTLVNSETYNGANLADFKTFRIVSPSEGHLPPGMQAVTYYNIAAAIREQMVERGYVESPTSPILINIGLTVKREIATEPLSMVMPEPAPPAPAPVPVPAPAPEGTPGPKPVADRQPAPIPHPYHPFFIYPRANYWPNYDPNAQVITGIYKEGVLTMDIVDLPRHLPLYTSSVATILTNGDSQFRNLQGIAEAVQTLFSKYPVPLLPQYKR